MGCVLFDWGDTLMIDYPEYSGPMRSWPHVQAVAHARETLGALRAAGWCTALATNAADSEESDIRAALARVGLDGLIDHAYCSRRVGHSKPSAEFFEFIMRDLGVDAPGLVMVGDSLINDVEGANRSGIHAIWLRPGSAPSRSSELSWAIGDLSHLPGVLEEIAGPGAGRD